MELFDRMATATDAFDLGLGFEGCPCFEYEEEGFRAQGHCWRTSYRGDSKAVPCKHRGVGLHVWGNRKMARRLKALLDAMDWYGKWPLTIEGPRPPKESDAS